MSNEERAVLIGAAQLIQKDVALGESLEPLAMFEQLAGEAARDAGIQVAALDRLDTIGIVDTLRWNPQNGPRLLAERLGAHPANEMITPVGGETPVVLVNRIAQRIEQGKARFALITGSNNLKTLRQARKQGIEVDWTEGGSGQPEALGTFRIGHSEHEAVYGLAAPAHIYPVFENALRARRGLDLETHRRNMGALCSRFSEVAAHNPYAWFPIARSAEEITTPTPLNRMIAFPYTKYMNAVIDTDQAAALLLASVQLADDLGVPETQRVYWLGGADAEAHVWFPSERSDLGACPALARATQTALSQSGVALDEIDWIDFYSCFPVAVEMACEMLGLREDDPRGLTVTGGLPYAGGPGSTYTLHALASMITKLRTHPGAKGLVTGNGWYLTKHSTCICSTAPDRGVPVVSSPLPEPPTTISMAREANGLGTLESYTIVYQRDGTPERGIVVGHLADGRRFLANTPDDTELLEAFARSEQVGRNGKVSCTNGRNLFEPQ